MSGSFSRTDNIGPLPLHRGIIGCNLTNVSSILFYPDDSQPRQPQARAPELPRGFVSERTNLTHMVSTNGWASAKGIRRRFSLPDVERVALGIVKMVDSALAESAHSFKG
jgi:hypothetical protein